MNPRPAAPSTGTVAAMGLADFERIALERNPTLRQAAAQVDATMSRSHQAGLYPNPTVGYVQEQIGTLGEVTPTASGIATKARERPASSSVASSSKRSSPAASSGSAGPSSPRRANAARWQAEAQALRVLNGVRVRFFEVLAAQRLIQIHRELVRLNDDAVRTTEQLVNVGQANEPDLLQAKVEARRAAWRSATRRTTTGETGSTWSLVVGAPELRPARLMTVCSTRRRAPLDFDATLADLLHRSPEIQAALSEIRRSQIMVQRERARADSKRYRAGRRRP